MMFKTEEKEIDWIVKMVKFWTCSFFLYRAFICGDIWAWWIVASLCVLDCMDRYKEWEDKNDSDN